MLKKLTVAVVSFALAAGLCPASALAASPGAVEAAASTTLSASAGRVALATQAKKPSAATKKKMKAAFKDVLRQARSGSVSYGGSGFGDEYTMFDMGADGRPELFVETSDPTWGGSFHAYDYHSGSVRYLGMFSLSSGWLYGAPKGVLYCASGRQGGYYVDQVVKSAGTVAKKTRYTSIAKSFDEWDAASARISKWLNKKSAKALKTKPLTSYGMLNSKIKTASKVDGATKAYDSARCRYAVP